MGKHIPGNPTFVVENMPGAGFDFGQLHVQRSQAGWTDHRTFYRRASSYSSYWGSPGIEFDAAKFEYIGVPTQDDYVIGISKKNTGISSMDQWMASKTIVKLGGVGVGSATDDIPKVLIATIGLPAQIVSGYKGTADCQVGVRQRRSSRGVQRLAVLHGHLA